MAPGDEPQGVPCSAEQRIAEDDDFAASLRGLSVLSVGRLPLTEMLTRVAGYAVQAIPGADGAGLTLTEPNRADTMVSTARFVAKVDAAQYGLGEGPCITAARDGVTMSSDSLGPDARWPRFGSRATRRGVHSALSLPLITAQEVVGTLNIYAHATHVFGDRAAQLGEAFAEPAAVAVHTARELQDARRTAAQQRNALDERMVIERAIGIVMSRSGIDETEALAQLTGLSQHEHVKLLQIASTLVAEAVRRARSPDTE